MDDILDRMKLRASEYPEVAEGTSCTQSSFKRGKKSFFFAGEQGGRYKAMFKLKDSIAEAEQLAADHPQDFQVGTLPWVTVRFSSDQHIPNDIWQRWMDESYELSC